MSTAEQPRFTSYSEKKGRLYVRRFDHDDARRRFAAGETISALARAYGVTYNAVHRAVTPGAPERQRANHRRWRTGQCEHCGGPAMRLVAGKRERTPDGRTLCSSCRGRVRRKPIKFEDGVVKAECGTCGTWKPLGEFPPRVARALGEGRRVVYVCSACSTSKRTQYRETIRVPCETCGKPCLPPSEKGPNGSSRARCRDCFNAEHRIERRAREPEAASPTRRAESSDA